MHRFFLLAGLLIISFFGVARSDTTLGVSKKNSSPSVESLLQQLAAPEYQVRAEASRMLGELGPEALPALRVAARKATDAEVRWRLERIIPEIESANALTPTKVTLAMVDQPVQDVIKELSKQSGYDLELSGGSNRKDKRLITVECEDASFWTALEAVCCASDLKFNENWYSNDPNKLRLDAGHTLTGVSETHGPFRVGIRGLYYQRNLDFSNLPANALEGPLNRRESLSINLGITVEPRLPLLGAAPPIFSEVIDDLGQSMIPPNQQQQQISQHYYSGGYRRLTHHVQAQLTPSDGGRSLRLLKGKIPVTVVASQEPKLTVENVLEKKSQTIKQGTTSLNIESVETKGDNIHVKLSVSESSSKNGRADYGWMSSVLQQRIALVDGEGNKYRSSVSNWNGNNNVVSGTIVLRPESSADQGIIAKLFGGKKPTKELKLVYYDWKTMEYAVPFEFTNLPLP